MRARMVMVDVNDLLSLFERFRCGGVIPADIFDLIGDCSISDIDNYARTCGDDYLDVKEDLLVFFAGCVGHKMVYAGSQ